jgi:hypothetical protein
MSDCVSTIQPLLMYRQPTRQILGLFSRKLRTARVSHCNDSSTIKVILMRMVLTPAILSEWILKICYIRAREAEDLEPSAAVHCSKLLVVNPERQEEIELPASLLY